MTPRLLLATTNPGKQREFRELLADCGWELVVPADLGIELDTQETGATYAGNATIKAVAACLKAGLPALADDSGIEVEALGGRPGVQSARYAGPAATDAERRALLLRELRGVPCERRRAAFRCVIAIAVPGGAEETDVKLCEGSCEGSVTESERGASGFGYDPIFLVPHLGRTMAELSPQEKNSVSHRGRAAHKARPALRRLARESGQAWA